MGFNPANVIETFQGRSLVQVKAKNIAAAVDACTVKNGNFLEFQTGEELVKLRKVMKNVIGENQNSLIN